MYFHRLVSFKSLKTKLLTIAAIAFAMTPALAGRAIAKSPRPLKTVNIRNPTLQHVFIVVEENIGYTQLMADAANMPYFQSLITKGGLATNYYANAHPSIGNYFELTTGNTISNDDSFAGPIPEPPNTDVVALFDASQKLKNGKPAPHPVTWKVYAENLPSPDPTVATTDPYEKHHNPFAYFPEVLNNPADKAKLVDFSQLQSDIAANTLPNYGFIVPNAYHSGHTADPGRPSGSDREIEVDQWLQNSIAPLVAAMNQQNGLVVILWDEGDGADNSDGAGGANGGGHSATLLLGQKVKPGYQSTNLYHHQSVLRLMLQSLRIKTLPGAAASAPQMGEFFHK
jgi:acid phosphatase